MKAARPMARLVPCVTLRRSMLATKSLQNPPDEIAIGRLETTMLPSPWRRAKPPAYSDDTRRVKPPTGTASGDLEGWAANGRKRRNAARVLRLYVDAGLNRTTRCQWDCRRVDLGNDASRQVLEHLALEAVVIGRMGRAPRNVRSIVMLVVRRRRLVRVGFGVLVRSAMVMRCGVDCDPWQEPQRGPGKREERVRRNPRTPASATRSALR